jgi:hypothetical protein
MVDVFFKKDFEKFLLPNMKYGVLYKNFMVWLREPITFYTGEYNRIYLKTNSWNLFDEFDYFKNNHTYDECIDIVDISKYNFLKLCKENNLISQSFENYIDLQIIEDPEKYLTLKDII